MPANAITHFIPDQLEKLGVKDTGFRNEILKQIVVTARQRIGDMRTAQECGNFRDLEFAAHSLKGAALIVGAEALVNICGQLESAALSPTDLEYQTLCDLAEESYQLLEQEILETYPELNL